MAAKNQKLFNPQWIERLRPPREGRLEIGDTSVPGLVLRVTTRGVKTFSVIYKVAGETHRTPSGRVIGGVGSTGRLLKAHQHRITLGRHPLLSLTEARRQAREILGTVSEGRDPRPGLREQSLARHTNTVEAVAHSFIELDAKPSVASWRNIERALELHVLPSLGGRPMGEVRRADVHALLDDLVARDRAGTAREVRKHLHRLFDWAVDREIVDSNPVAGLKRRDLKTNGAAGRELRDQELRAIWNGARLLGYPFGPLYRLLMLTGQRRGEWAGARRSEIDYDLRTLTIPADRQKSGRDHMVPLVGEAWEIVNDLPVQTGDYLFSTRAGHVPVSGFSKTKRQLDELALVELQHDDASAELDPYRVHDFRVTCKSRLASLGVVPETRDAVLCHAKVGMDRVYNKHDYAGEKRAALETYAAHILEVVS